MTQTPARRPFRLFERVIVKSARGGLAWGDEGEISRIYNDGSLEVEMTAHPSALDRARFGSLAAKPPLACRRFGRFPADEVRRPGER
jgi:hypothetical protein